MVAPTKEETLEFINNNKSFFTTPLSVEGQKEFQQFYQDENAIEQIADYSQKLTDLLYKYAQQLSKDSSKAVIYSWRKGDFGPALEHEEVRQFIIDNKDHPALVMWANRNPALETKEQEKNQEKPMEVDDLLKSTVFRPTPPMNDPSQKLAELTETFMKKEKTDFDYFFDRFDTQMSNGNVLIGRRLIREGLTGDLFKSQKDYDSWKADIISAKNQQTQTQTQTQTLEPSAPVQEESKGFIDLLKGLIDLLVSAVKNFCQAIADFCSSCLNSSENKNEGGLKYE